MSEDQYPEERWLDDAAGPVVRPYVMTYGRTQPSRGRFDLISLVVSIRPAPAAEMGFGPEHIKIIRLCRDPQSVAEIAAHLDLPAGTIRVLISDLLEKRFVEVQSPPTEANIFDDRMYKAVLDGLRAL
jgi:Protein of unknown function (DUF742).